MLYLIHFGCGIVAAAILLVMTLRYEKQITVADVLATLLALLFGCVSLALFVILSVADLIDTHSTTVLWRSKDSD